MANGIRIDELDATLLPSRDHVVPAMKDGLTVKLTVGQILDLLGKVLDPDEVGSKALFAALNLSDLDDPEQARANIAALSYESQSLDSSQKEQARENIAAVGYEGQSLSPAEQVQARANIDALGRDGSDIGDAARQLAFQRNTLADLAPFPAWDSTEFPQEKVMYELDRWKRGPRGIAIHRNFNEIVFPAANSYIGGVIDGRGYVNFIPFNATQTFLYNPYSGGHAFQDGAEGAFAGSGSNKWLGGCLGKNNHIYGIPWDAENVLVWERPLDGGNPPAEVSTFGLSLSGESKWYGGVLHPNGKIYAVPHSATDVLVIDTNTTPATAVRTDFGFGALTGDLKWASGQLAPNGKIYCAPRNAPDCLIIDPATETLTRTDFGLDLDAGAGTSERKWCGIALGADGYIYCVPRSAKAVLRIDWRDDTAELITWGFNIPAGENLWYGGVSMPDGRIYCIPRDATSFLIIDPIRQKLSLEGFGSSWNGTTKFGGAIGDAFGQLWCVPRDSNRMSSIKVSSHGWDKDFLLSGFMNKF